MNPSPSQHHMGLSIPDSTAIPTAYEATIGNVWQTTTWKRDTLLELKGELLAAAAASNPDDHDATTTKWTSLDDLATERQQWDLHLLDGLHRIIQQVEDGDDAVGTTIQEEEEDPCLLFLQRLEHKITAEMGASAHLHSNNHAPWLLLSESEWNRYLTWCQQEMETILSTTAILQPARIYPPIVRDLLRREDETKWWQNDHFVSFLQEQPPPPPHDRSPPVDHLHDSSSLLLLHHSVIRYRLLWTSALIQQLQPSWHVLTTRSDQDMDRDAAAGTTTEVATRSMALPALVAVLRAYLGKSRPAVPSTGSDDDESSTTTTNNNNNDDHLNSSSDPRMDALWDLMDHDRDGRMDQSEMDRTCQFHVRATQAAIRRFVTEVLEVVPLDHPNYTSPPTINKEEEPNSFPTTTKSKSTGWRQRRRMRQDQAVFRKRLNHVLKYHFDNELEMSHRLRCIYSWANKQHQNNKINSILVEEDANHSGVMTSVVGRKRYVELYPKIARSEFRQVQRIHFPQLDGVGQEYMKSLREEFWILQGKGRQNRELQRDCTLFLVGVCFLDYIVLSL